MGRLQHSFIGGQNTPDTRRMEQVMKRLENVILDMAPGDALFLDCLTLHRSGPNLSENPRWSLVGCYNTKFNNPYKPHHHALYSPLKTVSDNALIEMGVKYCESEFMSASGDETTRESKGQGSEEYAKAKEMKIKNMKNLEGFTKT